MRVALARALLMQVGVLKFWFSVRPILQHLWSFAAMQLMFRL